jgi:hypothetical protein
MSDNNVNNVNTNSASSGLMAAFKYAVKIFDDFEFFSDDLDASDLSHVIIQHGEGKDARKQSNISLKGGSFQNGTRPTDDKDSKLAVLKHGTDLIQAFPELYSIRNSINFDFSGLQDSIRNYTNAAINVAEIDSAAAAVASDIEGDLDYSLRNGAAEGHIMAPQHADGRFIKIEEKSDYEDENSICLAPLVEEQANVYNDGAEMIAFEKKLADPAQRATLTASDVPVAILDGIREERKDEFWATSNDERFEAFDKLAETMGFEATDTLSAYQVYKQQSADLDVDTQVKMIEGVMDINDSLEKEFDANWKSQQKSHAQAALDGYHETIAQNGGVYVPQFTVDADKLETLKNGIQVFEANNQDKLDAPLIKDETATPATIDAAATVTPPAPPVKYEVPTGP